MQVSHGPEGMRGPSLSAKSYHKYFNLLSLISPAGRRRIAADKVDYMECAHGLSFTHWGLALCPSGEEAAIRRLGLAGQGVLLYNVPKHKSTRVIDSTRSSFMEHSLDIEISYRKIFSRLNTRKKFEIQKFEGTKVTVEQDEEICGQKEPRTFEFNSEKELQDFVTAENQFERDIDSQLSGNDMPYR